MKKKNLLTMLIFCVVTFFSHASAIAICRHCFWDPCYDWDGLYAGINAGYGWGRTDFRFPVGGSGFGPSNLFSPDATGGSFHQHPRGGMLGGHIGFNTQWWCNLLFGLEGAFQGTWVKERSKNVFSEVPRSTTYHTSEHWIASMTPRFGYVCQNFLIYSKVGLAAARWNNKFNANNSYFFKQRQDHIGWTVGAGIEYGLCNWILGIEYDYYRLPRSRYGGEVDPDTTWPIDFTFRPSLNAVLVRLSYKFC